MLSKTNEQALEAHIEKALTGTCLEDLKAVQTGNIAEPKPLYQRGNGFYIGHAKDFNADLAIDEVRFWDFIEETQGEELKKIQRQSDWKRILLDRLNNMIKKYGILHLLIKGLEIDDAHFTLFYQLPLASSSEKVAAAFESNQFSVTRQVRYSKANPGEEIDLVLFLNGLPIVTMELKNHWTGQNARMHGQQQYKTQRDNTQTLLQFARCIVHMAVDTEEVYMTTKLDGPNTFFLPFNKGNEKHGMGNPVNPFGHRTSYLWDEIFTKQSLAKIIQHFTRLDGKAKDPLSKRTLFFPRYHQLNVVNRIVEDVTKNGVGKTYLIQHSAGSGKSNSITWAAYQLIAVYPENEQVQGARGIRQPLFDSVIVVTDRRLLDKQIKDNITSFSEVKNIVAHAHSSKDLRESLENGKKIIITTIQKFPFIVEDISDMSDKRFAVIIDEAHSSQGGTAADKMNESMGNLQEEDPSEIQDKIVAAMQARKMKGNASYLAFTATPKPITLEKFGVKHEDGTFHPFDLYSMKQAIEEGFILDVLANYTTFKSYYEIKKSIEENPKFESKKAQKKLKAFVERHKETIGSKAELILDHFIPSVLAKKKLKGKAKGMVVTQSIESAIRYYKALKQILEQKGDPFKVVIAFSGTKEVDGIEYTEADMNGFPEKDTKDMFDSDEYRLLVVANKYLTGFDQPKLCTMYVDKKLQGVLAVQALSRLNRSASKLGKKTEDLFVLDFFNSTDDIKEAFDPFYTSTSLSQATDVNVLHDLKNALDEAFVYEWAEVEAFNELYFSGANGDALSPVISVGANRFNFELDLSDDDKADFKIKAKQFVKIYGQMAALMDYEMIKWEKLFWYLKLLIPHLVIRDPESDALDELMNSINFNTYGLERTKLNEKISLDEEASNMDPQNANPRGAHGTDEEKDPLDLIVQNFNVKWFQDWNATPEEKRVKLITLTKNVQAHPDFESKVANNPDLQNRRMAFKKIIDEVIHKQRKSDMDWYKKYIQDSAFNSGVLNTMAKTTKIDLDRI